MRAPLSPGENPRLTLRRHRERGPKAFAYTYADIARAAGVQPQTVRVAVSEKRLDPASLESVVAFVAERCPRSTPT